ncbi:hypothetical protein CON65_07210, partial [Bacillus pseudomycoides]
EVKAERATELRLLFILHSRDLDAEKLKWIYIVIFYHGKIRILRKISEVLRFRKRRCDDYSISY